MKADPESLPRRDPIRHKLWVAYFLMFALPVAYLLYVIGCIISDGTMSDDQMTMTKVAILIGFPAILIMSTAAFILLEHSLKQVRRLLVFVEASLHEFKAATVSLPPSGDDAEQVSHYVRGMISEFKRHISEVDRQAETLQAANVRLADHALIDDKTNLYNEKHGMNMLEVEIHRATRSGNPLSVIRADIRDLDVFRSTHGDALTDSAIIATGKHLASRVRRVDVVAHLADGRFLILLLETPSEGAKIVADRMVASTAGLRFPCAAGGETSVSIAVGISSLEGESDGGKLMFDRAEVDLRRMP
jgi:diguanylate cyclase (GGDEF)-like protein